MGRNDQVYAEYLATRHHGLPGQVFFLKDSSFHYGGHDFKKYERSAVQMAQELRTRGFSCGRAPPHCGRAGNGAQWHELAVLEAFVRRDWRETAQQALRGAALALMDALLSTPSFCSAPELNDWAELICAAMLGPHLVWRSGRAASVSAQPPGSAEVGCRAKPAHQHHPRRP